LLGCKFPTKEIDMSKYLDGPNDGEPVPSEWRGFGELKVQECVAMDTSPIAAEDPVPKPREGTYMRCADGNYQWMGWDAA
jgi:hypothetical protein